jgi:hypothetical protein
MFSLRQTTADLDLEPFQFEGLDGEVYELPNYKSLSIDLATRIEQDGAFLEVLAEIGTSDATMAQVTAACVGALEPFVKAWMSASETKPGESQASSRSTASTARPSKPTSRSAAGSKTRKR